MTIIYLKIVIQETEADGILRLYVINVSLRKLIDGIKETNTLIPWSFFTKFYL